MLPAANCREFNPIKVKNSVVWIILEICGLIAVCFFEFESLEFICYLGFVIWNLQYFKAHYFITA